MSERVMSGKLASWPSEVEPLTRVCGRTAVGLDRAGPGGLEVCHKACHYQGASPNLATVPFTPART
jgi:hypothetical protein